uniref:Uncharacterized protein n=1 Tax=Fagus sylvatica TaxID=28930 RepID=A0A2N9F7L1_FAGSY
MALSKASLMALMALLFTALSLIGAAQGQAAESPAPSPASPASAISPCLGSALLATAVAFVFGSKLRN